MKRENLQKGDYVLATKYSDGEPGDQWCVGFYDGMDERGRHFVVDGEGKQFRGNGFRRVKKITRERGEFILRHKDLIENGSDWSLWWWARVSISRVDGELLA